MFILLRRALKFLATALFAPTLLLARTTPAPIRIAMIEGLSGPFANTGEAPFELQQEIQ